MPKYRLTLHSNYDCINSDWMEQSSGGYDYYDSYFGDMVDFLQLNPRVLRDRMHKANFTLWRSSSTWPNIVREPMVDYGEFMQELLNNSCTSLLVIPVQLGTLDVESIERIMLHKGATCGLFSDWQGGGSMIECKIKPGTTIPLGRRPGNRHVSEHPHPDVEIVPDDYTEHDSADLVLDSHGYSMEAVYGPIEFAEVKTEWRKG